MMQNNKQNLNENEVKTNDPKPMFSGLTYSELERLYFIFAANNNIDGMNKVEDAMNQL